MGQCDAGQGIVTTPKVPDDCSGFVDSPGDELSIVSMSTKVIASIEYTNASTDVAFRGKRSESTNEATLVVDLIREASALLGASG